MSIYRLLPTHEIDAATVSCLCETTKPEVLQLDSPAAVDHAVLGLKIAVKFYVTLVQEMHALYNKTLQMIFKFNITSHCKNRHWSKARHVPDISRMRLCKTPHILTKLKEKNTFLN